MKKQVIATSLHISVILMSLLLSPATFANVEVPQACRDLFARSGAVPGEKNCIPTALFSRGGLATVSCTGNRGRKLAQAYCEQPPQQDNKPAFEKDWLAPFKTNDPKEIFSLVANKILFEPYVGAMRDPNTVAIVGAGNSLDQAILLREVLAEAGHITQLRQGRLDRQQQNALIMSFFAPSKATLYSPDAEFQYDPLKDPELIAATEDHFWIELLHNGQWVVLDPSFPGAEFGHVYAKPLKLLADVPAFLYHKIKLTMKVKIAGETARTLGHISTRVSEAGLRSLSLIVSERPAPDKKEGSSKPKTVTPMGGVLSSLGGLSGAKPKVQQKEKNKAVYEAKVVLDGKSRSFKSYAVAKDDLPEIREWLEIELQSPGREPMLVERTLFETDKSHSKPAEWRHYVATILPGRVPQTYADQLAVYAEKQLPTSSQIPDSEAESTELHLGNLSGRLTSIMFAAESDHFSYQVAHRNGVAVSYSEPRVYITSTEVKNGTELSYDLDFDLRVDQVNSYPMPGAHKRTNYLYQNGRGILQSTLEGLLLERFNKLKANTVSTATVMAAAIEQKIPLEVITAKQSLVGMPLKPQAKRHIENALSEGMHIVLPQSPVKVHDKLSLGWWEINPETGATIGVLENGLHGAIVEYTILTRKVSVSDVRGFTLGLLAGSISTQTLIIATILRDGGVSEESAKAIKQQLESICSPCALMSAQVKMSYSAGVDCFTLASYTETLASLNILKVPFCGDYVKGFKCAVNFILRGFDPNPNIKAGAPISLSGGCGKIEIR